MLPLSPVRANFGAQLFLYAKDVDMRRSFDGLMGIVQSEFRRDILQGDTFLFLNKRRDRIKILWWDGDGMAIFMKRLEAGTYQRPLMAADQVSLLMDRTEVELLLSGIELSSVKRRKRYQVQTKTLTSSAVADHSDGDKNSS
jgi:transposase